MLPHFLLGFRYTNIWAAEAKAEGADGAGVTKEETSVTGEIGEDCVVDLLDGVVKVLLCYLEKQRNVPYYYKGKFIIS